MEKSGSGPNSSNVFESSALRAVFARKNRLRDQQWLREVFTRACDQLTMRSSDGKPGRTLKLKKHGGVIEYQIPTGRDSGKGAISNVLIQHFCGAELKLRSLPAMRSIIFVLSYFPDYECNRLNGQISAIIPDAKFKPCDCSALYC